MDDHSGCRTSREPHATTGAPGHAFPIGDGASIELRFDESGSYRNSLSCIPERYVCLWPGCKVTCKRVYELKRHVNRHKPRRCWYCPISGCSFASDYRRTGYLWSTSGSPAAWTTKLIDNRTRRTTLLGFSRLDKLQNHLQKEHSEICNDLETVESLIGPKPGPVAPVVLELHMTDRVSNHQDSSGGYYWGSGMRMGYYVVEVTEIVEAPTQETATTLDRVSAQPDSAPTELVDTTSPPANGSSTSPFPAPEQGFLTPYLEAQVDVTNAGSWFFPSDPQQTANTSNIGPFPAPEQGFLSPYLEVQPNAMNAGNWVHSSDPQTATASRISPFPAPEHGFLEPYLEAQVDVTNAIYWDLPFDPQQTDDFTSYLG